jgi:hypothetical protein
MLLKCRIFGVLLRAIFGYRGLSCFSRIDVILKQLSVTDDNSGTCRQPGSRD